MFEQTQEFDRRGLHQLDKSFKSAEKERSMFRRMLDKITGQRASLQTHFLEDLLSS